VLNVASAVVRINNPDAAGLALRFATIGRDLAALERTEAVFQAITETAVDQVPGAELAGITIIRGTAFQSVAATSESVRRLDSLQFMVGAGPGVDAITQRSSVRVEDLRTDPRWPRFGRRAFDAEGVVSMLALRFFLDDKAAAAALSMYSTQRAAFDDDSATAALLLTTHGAVAVSSAAARGRATSIEATPTAG
jgi:hypothetical protein